MSLYGMAVFGIVFLLIHEENLVIWDLFTKMVKVLLCKKSPDHFKGCMARESRSLSSIVTFCT